MVLVSVVCPLDNLLLVLGFSFTNVESLSAPGSKVEGVFSLEVGIIAWDQLPEFVFLLVWLTAKNLSSVVVLSFCDFDSHIVLGAEDGVLVVSN